MTLGIWLVPVLLGFAILKLANIHRRAFTATTGYQFFFLAASAGAILLVVAYLTVLAMDSLCDALLPQVCITVKAYLKCLAPFTHSGKLVVAALWGLAYILAMNMRISDQDAAARWAENTEGRAEFLLRRSLENRTLVEVAMKTGRSYVGFVVRGNNPNVNWSGDVGLLPMFSGYRDNNTRSLHLTNNYTELSDFEEREVVVMRSEIASIRRFDLDAYRAVESGEAELPTALQKRPL